MSGAWADNQVYWATLAYARWWLAVDGPLLAALGEARDFTPSHLRRVAVRYNVARGMVKDENKSTDAAVQGLCDLIAAARTTWPNPVEERAKRCLEIARNAQRLKFTGETLQVSAVSKFMWFVEPRNWTMFDRFVVRGMKVPANLTAPERFTEFYRRISAGGFATAVAQMQPIIGHSKLPTLPAERIVDSLLMARGKDNKRDRPTLNIEVAESRAYLGLLPPTFRDDLHRLATQLQDEIGNDVLLPKTTKRKKS